MNYSSILNQVMILFLIMLIGYLARKRNIINEETNYGLSKLLLDVTLPAFLVTSFNFQFSNQMLMRAGALFLIGFVILIVLAIISKVLYMKYPRDVSSVLRFATIFSNNGFMGYPIILSIYGKLGVFYTAIFNIPFTILVFTLGVMLFSKKKDFKSLGKELLNPSLISIIIGLFIFIFSVKIPYPIYQTLNLVGSMTTPLAMMIVGSLVAEVDIKYIFGGTVVYYVAIVRLIVTPLVVLLIMKAFGASGMFLGIPVLISGMPGASLTSIMAEKYGGDSILASKCVLITTILSAITIPLMLLLL